MSLDIFNVIQRPILTEKVSSFEKLGKYVFVVNARSTKDQIKNSVEKIFKVSVKSVNIINIRGKVKVFKGKKGKRSNFKKAVVTTNNMQKIEFSKGI